jgi:hypothetical protein
MLISVDSVNYHSGNQHFALGMLTLPYTYVQEETAGHPHLQQRDKFIN